MPPFTGSNVPLQEDILKKVGPREFFPTWSEWAAQNRDQIVLTTGVATNTTVITVAEGFNLFIISAFIDVVSNTANQGGAIDIMDGAAISKTILQAFAQRFDPTAGSQGGSRLFVNYQMPIKVFPGQSVRHRVISAVGLTTGIFGWLEPKKI